MTGSDNLLYCNFVTYKGRRWFWSINFNALFSADMEWRLAKKIGKYAGCAGSDYTNTVLYQGKLILLPGMARRIMIFDIESNVFRFIELVEMEGIEQTEKNLFYGYAIKDEILFMIGNQIPCLLKFNMKTEQIENAVNLFPEEEKREIYFRDAIIDQKQLVIPAFEDDLLFEVNTDTLHWTRRHMKHTESGFSSICKAGDSVWLLPREKDPVIQWRRQTDIMTEHEMKRAGYQYIPMQINFHSGIYLDNKIWIFPFFGSSVFSINLNTSEISGENAINRYLDGIDLLHGQCIFRAVQEEAGSIYLLCCASGIGELLLYDPGEDRLKKIEKNIEIPKSDCLAYMYYSGIPVVNEEEYPLEDFLCFLKEYTAEKADGKQQKADTYGHRIYEAVKNS